MTSATNKPFHTYENVGFEDQANNSFNNYQASSAPSTNTMATNNINNGVSGIAMQGVESPFTDPNDDSPLSQSSSTTRIISAADSTGMTRMLTSKSSLPGQNNLVTKLISLPAQSPMDSFKEFSLRTFKLTKQMMNEKRGNCSITNDAQLQADIDQLRETRNKLLQMLRSANQMNMHYSELVKTQRQLHGLMSEMSVKCFTNSNKNASNINNYGKQSSGKQIVANFSSLSNNLLSTTTASPTHTTLDHNGSDNLNDFLPILNHIKSSTLNISEDFKKNAMSINATIKNGEKLVAALTFFCSNLSTLIHKTFEDTLITIRQFEAARLEFDAERNSITFSSPTAQTSITYSSDKLELARIRYEQLKDDVQIKMKFLEENTIKVMHKQMLLFHGAFAAYSNGNSAALDSTLKSFSINTDNMYYTNK